MVMEWEETPRTITPSISTKDAEIAHLKSLVRLYEGLLGYTKLQVDDKEQDIFYKLFKREQEKTKVMEVALAQVKHALGTAYIDAKILEIIALTLKLKDENLQKIEMNIA